jgi:rod shape determining protein RodA
MVDGRLALVSMALVFVGLLSIYSATYDAGLSGIAFRQMLWAAGGVVALVVAAAVPSRVLQSISLPAYVLGITLLVLVLLVGKAVSGSQSWFNLGPFRLQPSEFAKISTAMALSSYLARSDVSLQNLRNLAVASGMVLLPVVLILLQPDAGTAIIYLGMVFPVLFWGNASRFTLIALVAPVAAALAALFGPTPFLVVVLLVAAGLYFTRENRILAAAVFSLTVLVGISVQFIYEGLKPYQQRRIDTFLSPEADPRGAGYNVLQSKVAIGSGGFLGKGYLKGTQTQLNFIPAQWTDFIFCVPGEEFGFVGAATVLFLFAVFLARGVQIASMVKNSYASFLAVALTGTFATHVFINIGMALGLLPVIGVPLPFLSYGGSSLIANMTMVGILLNLYANRKEY